MKEESRIKAVLFPVLSSLAGVVVALLVLEAVIRFFPVGSGRYVARPINAQQPVLRYLPNRDYTYSRGWNFRGVNTGRINNYGFINDQDYDPAAISPLAAVIGDSYIEARMVPYAKTLHGRLADSVRGRGRVYSFGFSGAPLSQYLAWASWVRDTFHPGLLVVTVIGNDFDESLLRYKNAPGYHYFDDSREDMPLILVDMGPGLFQGAFRLGKVSRLYSYVMQNLELPGIIWRSSSPGDIEYVGNAPAVVESERIERSKKAVDAFLGRLPGASGVPAGKTIFVMDGARPQLYVDGDLPRIEGSYFGVMRRYFMEQAARRGYVVSDLQPRFIERHRAMGERFEYPDDGHWNEAGHEMAMQAVKESRIFREQFGL